MSAIIPVIIIGAVILFMSFITWGDFNTHWEFVSVIWRLIFIIIAIAMAFGWDEIFEIDDQKEDGFSDEV